MTPQPHEPDINALVRDCYVQDIPCATNRSTVELRLEQMKQVGGRGTISRAS